MASSSNRKSGSSGRSTTRRRVVIGADETVRVRYSKDKPQVEAERTKTSRTNANAASRRAGIGPRPTGVGKRIASTRRDERDKRRRGIRLRRQALSASVLILAIAIVWGIGSFARSDTFRVRTVSVSGNAHLSAEQVRRIAAVPSRATMFSLGAGAIEKRLLADAWIASATVNRDFPHGVVIVIKERKPLALVDAGGANLFLVAGDGYWLGSRSTEDTATLVSIRDIEKLDAKPGRRTSSKELLNALAIIRDLSPELLAQVKSISAMTVEKTALLTKDDVEIFFGSSADAAKKDRIIREILTQQRGKVVYINVRVVDRPIWRGIDAGK